MKASFLALASLLFQPQQHTQGFEAPSPNFQQYVTLGEYRGVDGDDVKLHGCLAGNTDVGQGTSRRRWSAHATLGTVFLGEWSSLAGAARADALDESLFAARAEKKAKAVVEANALNVGGGMQRDDKYDSTMDGSNHVGAAGEGRLGVGGHTTVDADTVVADATAGAVANAQPTPISPSASTPLPAGRCANFPAMRCDKSAYKS